MKIIEKITNFLDFLDSIFLDSTDNASTEQSDEKKEENLPKRTWLERICILEQKVASFEYSFPTEYKTFMDKIEKLKEKYNSDLEAEKEILQFDSIHPEIDFDIIGPALELEEDVAYFIEHDVKFDTMSKQFERFIVKLNILYNVSIFHFEEDEKEKVRSHLGNALEAEERMIKDFKESQTLLSSQCSKERIISLISYADYMILKSCIRNSKVSLDEIIENLAIVNKFKNFDYLEAFITFARDELLSLSRLLLLVKDIECRRSLRRRVSRINVDFMSTDNAESVILNTDFWNEFCSLESDLLMTLRMSGVEKDKAKVQLLSRMDISVEKDDVLATPKMSAYLALIKLFLGTEDRKFLVLTKLIKNLSDEITYREIYFLLLLFEVIEVVKNTPNDLIKNVAKYQEEYSYSKEAIAKKKKLVKNSTNKEYLVAFALDEYREEIIRTLEDLNMDFYIDKADNLFINSFYFTGQGLENILKSLQLNTKNITL